MMDTETLLSAYDRYVGKVYEASNRAERRFWQRHADQMVIALNERGRRVREEGVDAKP